MGDRFDHDLVCNGARNQPIGASGHGCSCLGRLQRDRERLSAALKRVAELRAENETLRKVILASGDLMTEMEDFILWCRASDWPNGAIEIEARRIAERRAGRKARKDTDDDARRLDQADMPGGFP